jgi:cell division protein DivIC
METIRKIPAILRNKYLLTLAAFLVWMCFFDDRDIITTHVKHKQELKQLQKSKLYFEEQIQLTQKELSDLKTDPATLEKYAREKYMMKRAHEDLFIVKD